MWKWAGMDFSQVDSFVVFNIDPSGEMPTKPFGIPYRIAVLDTTKGKGIVADDFDHILELWVSGFSTLSPEKKKMSMFKMGQSVSTQLQANEIHHAGVKHLSPEDRMTILEVSSSVTNEDIEWEHETKIYVICDGKSVNNDSSYVKCINIENSFSFVASLESLGIINVLAGERPTTNMALDK